MRTSLFTLVPLLALATGCAPSVDPALRAKIDGQIAAAAPHDTRYPAPTTRAPMPLAAGQWTRIKRIDKDRRPSLLTYKVLGQEGDASWVEVVTEQYTGRTVLKMLVAFGDRTDVNKVEIRHVVLKQGDRAPLDYQQPLLGMVQGTFKGVAKGLVIRWEGLPQETKVVPAGTFTDAFKTDAEVSVYGFTSRGRTWSHSAVPIQGLVYAENDDGSTMDLLDFGMTGATSEM